MIYFFFLFVSCLHFSSISLSYAVFHTLFALVTDVDLLAAILIHQLLLRFNVVLTKFSRSSCFPILLRRDRIYNHNLKLRLA